MSDERYPLVKQMGLEVAIGHIIYKVGHGFGAGDFSVVKANDLEAKLASAPVVYGTNGRGKEIDYRANMWAPDPARFNSCDHHKGRIICIEPVTLESAEALMRRIASIEIGTAEWIDLRNELRYIIERARKLLASATESE